MAGAVASRRETAPIPGFGHDDRDRRVESGVDVPVRRGGRMRLNVRITCATLIACRFAASGP